MAMMIINGKVKYFLPYSKMKNESFHTKYLSKVEDPIELKEFFVKQFPFEMSDNFKKFN